MIKKLILLLVLLSIIGGIYYWLTNNEEPIFLDTTLDKYQVSLDASEKCNSADKPNAGTCQKVIKILDAQIQKIINAENGSKKYRTELIRLYRAEEKAHVKLNDTQSAVNLNLKVLNLEPQVASHYSRLSNYYLKMNAHKEAIRYARLTTQLAPFQWQAFRTLGKAMAADKRYAEADEAYLKASHLAPSSHAAGLEKLRKDLQVKQSLLTSPSE